MQGTSNPLKKMAIITPSRIGSRKRHGLASASLKSLRRCIGADVSLLVVHDSYVPPRHLPRVLSKLIPAARWDRSADDIYADRNTRLIRRIGRGSAGAMREAVSAAIADGAVYGFIHLDDHVYRDDFRNLLLQGVDALDANPDLLWVRFSGYPIICNGRPQLAISEDRVGFDTVSLRPLRNRGYTLWWSALDSEVIRGRYWPVAMWFCVYRLPVLARMLDWALERAVLHLAHVELYFKQADGFARLQQAYPAGKFGYINMQDGGIEMHRNANWRELLQLSNNPVL